MKFSIEPKDKIRRIDSLGGDDFIRMPYHISIWITMAKAVLKQKPTPYIAQRHLSYRGVCLNLSKCFVERKGKSTELTKHEYILLNYLLKHPNKIVAREDLIEEFCHNQVYIDDKVLSVNMTRLRNKLRKIGAPDLIKTKFGQGYLV